ncbi:unnamed protein product, partial [Symbiodinium sp. CCMP2456]
RLWRRVGHGAGGTKVLQHAVHMARRNFRIATPLALLLFIPRQSFNNILDNYSSEQQRFCLVKENTKPDGCNAAVALSLPLHPYCDLQDWSDDQRSGSMYIIKGGSAEVFVNHRYVKEVMEESLPRTERARQERTGSTGAPAQEPCFLQCLLRARRGHLPLRRGWDLEESRRRVPLATSSAG